MRLFALYIALLTLVSIPVVRAQDNNMFSSYGVDDGLPQSSIWSIAQDKNGFLWLGTSDGVCRFDGYNFSVYRNKPNDPHSVIGGLYFRFYADSSGNIWIISQNGISLYNDVNDNFNQVFVYHNENSADNYNCIFGEDAQYIWAGLSTYGFVKIDKKTHKTIPVENKGFATLSSAASWQSGFVNKGKVWIAGSNSDCYVYDISSGGLQRIDVPHLYKIVDVNDSEVLAATKEDLVLFSKKDYSYKKIHLNGGYARENTTDIFIASDSEIILASTKGLFYVNTRTWTATKHIKSFTQDKKTSFVYTHCIYRDRSGNLWIGTNGDGLKKLVAPYKKFKFYSSFNEKGNIVKSIYANKEMLFAGYYDNGISIFSRAAGLQKTVPVDIVHSSINSIYSIVPADERCLLIQNPKNIYLYSPDNGRIRDLSPEIKTRLPTYTTERNNFPFLFKTEREVYFNMAGTLASLDVSLLPRIKAHIVHHFDDQMLTCIFRDHNRTLWIGSLNGAWYQEKDTWKKAPVPEIVQVKSINEDAAGNTWIGTIRGIYIIDSNKKLVNYFSEHNGLYNQFIYGILRDDAGNMWFSHNKGLSVYKTAAHTFRHYTKEDGLQSNEFNTGAYFKSADGELFFGGINGVNSFKPEDILDNPHAPETKITNITLFDQPLSTDTAYWDIHTLALPYEQNTLGFEFAATEYTNPAKNQYAYMMENLDKDWIYAKDKRFVRYSSLPPGDYVFKVKASNNDGVWQKNPATIRIIIIPPYWQQLWFRIVSLLLFIGCFTGVIMWIQKQKHKKQIRAMELQQTIQQERERISRDLHDNVGTQLSLISNNIEWVTHPLKEIGEKEKNEKLQFANDTARDIIATLRETIWALNKQQIPLEEFSDKLKSFVQKQLSQYPQMALAYNEDISETVILGPSEALNLFRICQEAVANALKYSGANTLTINVQSRGHYQVGITDNGKGFDINSVDPSVQNGLENMRYRAEDIGCTLAINTAPGTGTEIVITKK